MKSIRIIFLVLLCISFVGVVFLFGFLAAGKQIDLPGADRDLVKALDQSWKVDDYISIEFDSNPLDIFITVNPAVKDIHVSCYQYEDWDVNVKDDNKNLYISAPGRNSNHTFFWYGIRKSPYFSVEIPEDFDGVLKLQTQSGDIEMKGNFSANTIQMTTSSGDVHLDDMTAKLISLKCMSGDIFFRELIGERIDIETSSGEVTGGKIDSDMHIKTMSGDLKIKELAGCGEISTSSGEIELGTFTQMQGNVSLETSSGEIDVKNFDILGGDLSLISLSGDIAIFFNEKPDASVEGKTNSGELHIFKSRYNRSVRLEDHAASYQIWVETSSGDIRLRHG